MTSVLDDLADRLGPLARRDVPLAPLTTYRVGGAAALMVRAESVDDLRLVAAAIAGTGVTVLVVGRGSNLLVSDDGFHGLALQLGDAFAQIDIDAATVRAGAAVALPVLARRTAAAGLTGLEWAVGVPGSVGGAVRMNAGGHGSDVAASLVAADVIDLATGSLVRRPVASLDLRFRNSGLGDHEIVIGAEFSLALGDREVSESEIAEIVRWRREHQPGGQNAGSVFVNPVPGVVAAGELIEKAGLRGYRLGTAEVSPKHANFIQADEGGRAGDVHSLIEFVRATVAQAHGVVMRSEVRLVGFAGEHDRSLSGPSPAASTGSAGAAQVGGSA